MRLKEFYLSSFSARIFFPLCCFAFVNSCESTLENENTLNKEDIVAVKELGSVDCALSVTRQLQVTQSQVNEIHRLKRRCQ